MTRAYASKRANGFSPAQLLRKGLASHREGQLAEAARCYASILAHNPRHADALHLTGLLALRRSDMLEAERYISLALRESPACAIFHQNLACVMLAQERFDDAIKSYRAASQLDPKDLKTLVPLAELLGQAGETDEALSLFREVLRLDPGHATSYGWLGTLLKRSDPQGALDVFLSAAKLFPDFWEAHFNLGGALFEANQLAAAIPAYEQVIRLRPDYADAYNCLGRILHELNDFPGARSAYVKALELDDRHADALSNLGALLFDEGHYTPAEQMLRRALEVQPGMINAYSNLGTLLTRTGDTQGAVECFRQVLTQNPRHVPALCSIGFLHDVLGDEQGATGYFTLALEVEPGSALARFNLSSHLLANGDFRRGWQDYECRWQVRQFYSKRKQMEQPQWRGEDIKGSRILLYSEQGFGDTFQFVRYVPMVAALGAEVLLEVQGAVYNLLHDMDGAKMVVAGGTSTGPFQFDWHCPLMSLPLAFGTTLDTIPVSVPYLHAQPAKVEAWSRRITGAGIRAGIVWSGNPEHTRDKLRSIALTDWSDVLGVDGVTFYSLQKGGGAVQLADLPYNLRPTDLNAELLDFTDTAAVIANLDLVICVDTAVAHLAGAMGKPVWLLIPPAADWRWLRGRSDSPWYPTARLFRRAEGERWRDVLDRVHRELEEMVGRDSVAFAAIGTEPALAVA